MKPDTNEWSYLKFLIGNNLIKMYSMRFITQTKGVFIHITKTQNWWK